MMWGVASCSFDPSGGSPADTTDARVVDAQPGADADPSAPDARPGPDANAAAFCDPADPTLVVCYRFEGDAVDGSMYGNDATAVDASFSAGVSGDALVTTAASNVAVASSSGLDVAALTMEMWLRPAAIPGDRAGLLDNSGQYRLFLHSGGRIRCRVTGGAELFTANDAVTQGQFTHVACTYDGAVMRIYIDGTESTSLPFVGSIPTGGGSLTIAQNNPSGDNLEGALDSLRMWSRIRTPAEICEAAGC